MDFLPEEFDEILNIFRGETEEIIQKLNNNLLQLETNPDNKELLVYLFRDAHSLKGAARMIGFNNIQRLAHKSEDVLGYAKENKIAINKEISTALLKAIDLISDMINESVKLKKEYYTDDIQSQIDAIDVLLEKYSLPDIEETNPVSKPTEDEHISIVRPLPLVGKKEKVFRESVLTINALISEAYLILKNIRGEEGSAYIETFDDLIKQLAENFENTKYFEIKEEIRNISAKTEFVLKNTKILTNTEINDIYLYLSNIVNLLTPVYEELGVEKFDFSEFIAEKNNQNTALADNNQEEKTTSDNSAMKEFLQKMDFVKDGINNLEHNLSHIADLREAIKVIIELSRKKEAIEILNKIEEILDILRQSNSLPEKEVISILRQSTASVEKITFATKEEAEDITLVLQRLDIIKQMLDLNTTINPLNNLSMSLNDTNLPVKKAQDFFNSFESTSIRTLRVDSKKLDTLVNQVGELIIARIKQKKNTAELEKILEEIIELKNFNNKSQSFIKYYDRKYLNATEKIDYTTFSVFSKQVFSILQENSIKIMKLINKIINLQKSVDEEDTKQTLIVTQLENMVKNIRVLPLATIFHMFPRMIRDIAQDTGKDIELLISGSETSADKKVIEEIKAPLMHIIRNSIDHGIETPQERIEAGKPAKGKIYLIARSYQNKIIIEIHDDGRGIDLQKILNRALEKGLITQREASYLTAEQIMNIIFWPGFSTEQVVTELSGRGVGLDIVQTKINQLNGTVKVYSVQNQGTKITIELPISMSTMKAFIVEASGQLFAMSMPSIKNVMWIDEKDIYVRNSIKTIMFEDRNVNIFYLSELMELPLTECSEQSKKTVVMIEIENSLMGIIVDRILGDQNILQKKLEPPIIKLKNISGITTLANGEVCLILNLVELYKGTYTSAEKPIISIPRPKISTKINSDYNILIVDDSLTTRKLLQNILENKGYRYEMVQNPREAFDILYKEKFDLILSDMEMPEMTGKEFVQRLKADVRYKDIPVVVISSYNLVNLEKEIPQAHAYIAKSNFNQDNLLAIIEKILKDGQVF